MTDVDNYMDLDTAIDKFKAILKDSHPTPEQLKKYQKILDGIADTYADFHDRAQLSELYSIQAEIYELSGEHQLAKDARFRAKDVKINHKRTHTIFIVLAIASLLAIVGLVFYIITQRQAELSARRADCLSSAKSSAEAEATLETNKSDYAESSPEYKNAWQTFYDQKYRELEKECKN